MTKLNDDDWVTQIVEKRRNWMRNRGFPHDEKLPDYVMRYIERLEAVLEPFKSGEWGAWKAWMVEGAPTREIGILAAKTITKYQCRVDEVLAQHGGGPWSH